MTDEELIARARELTADRPCPPWCDMDHSDELARVCVGGGGGIGNIWTRAVRMPGGDVMVSLDASLPDPDDDWPSQRFDLRAAEHMAVIIGLLADATPGQHRELAAAIRRNAALIADAAPAGRCTR